jgi:hypothetical protein
VTEPQTPGEPPAWAIRPRGGARGALLAVADRILALAALAALPAVWPVARFQAFRRARQVYRARGVHLVRHHYYAPTVERADLRHPLDRPRPLPGLDLNIAGQRALVSAFRWGDELRAIPLAKPDDTSFGYRNDMFGPGDAEMLYNMIRHFRPARIIEIGSGQSTLMARQALAANRAEDAGYACRHTCIEPYEVPWLERIGVDVIRQRVETVDAALFATLSTGDILFIDSSHVIRPQGDVVHEILTLLPTLAPGVIVHVHDIFTPRDYPDPWVIAEQRMWDEQYLLEAFLSFNSAFEVLLAVNMLHADHPDLLAEACPVLCADAGRYLPGSFWFRRRPA